MPVDFTMDLERVHPEVRQSIIRGLQHEDKARYALGRLEQLRLKKFHDEVVGAGCNGELRLGMVMSPDQRTQAMRIYGQMCFADPDFPKFLLRKHEEYRVKDVGTRVQSGWTGAGDCRLAIADCRLKKGGARG